MASQSEARAAIYAAVEHIAKSATEEFSGPAAGVMLRDVAVAYRAASGGAQVGGVFVDGN